LRRQQTARSSRQATQHPHRAASPYVRTPAPVVSLGLICLSLPVEDKLKIQRPPSAPGAGATPSGRLPRRPPLAEHALQAGPGASGEALHHLRPDREWRKVSAGRTRCLVRTGSSVTAAPATLFGRCAPRHLRPPTRIS